MNASARFISEFARCQRQLHAFICSVVWNLAEADDVLQETNLVLWQKAEQYDDSRDFLAWAMRFAQLQAMAWVKRRNRLPLLIEPGLLELLASEALAESLECEAQRVALSACIEKLPADHRALIASRYEPDASVNEMAAARHTSPKALSEMLRRIRRALLACVMKTLSEESYA